MKEKETLHLRRNRMMRHCFERSGMVNCPSKSLHKIASFYQGNKTIYGIKSSCGYTRALLRVLIASGVVVVNAGCVLDGKISMPRIIVLKITFALLV